MPSPQDPDELASVVKAITCGTTGCCEWDVKSAKRLQRAQPLPGISPEGIRDLLCQYVLSGGTILQVMEKRPEYSDRRFYYKAIVPVADWPKDCLSSLSWTTTIPTFLACESLMPTSNHPEL
jgi:hypothetical protein